MAQKLLFMKTKTLLLTIPCLLLIQSACQNIDRLESSASKELDTAYCISKESKNLIGLDTIQQRPIQEQLTISGKVEYNENDLVSFKSLIQGIVEQVNFELGDEVKKGQLLATVKSSDIQQLLQDRRYQESQIALIEKQIGSKKELLKDGLIAKPELLTREYELAAAKIELDKINAALQLFKATSKGTFQLIAPKNGMIVKKNISPGQSISSEDNDMPLFAISNLKQVWILINIHATNLPYIHLNDEVQIRTLAYPDRTYSGRIDKIYNVFDDDEHVLKARVVLSNEDLKLLPGLSADIIVNKRTNTGEAFAIPNKAKIFHNNKEYVVLYNSDCDLQVKEIKGIASNEDYTYVQEEFANGQQIISRNPLLFFEQLIP